MNKVTAVYRNILLTIVVLSALGSCQKHSQYHRPVIELSGHWRFSLDSANVGVQQNWFSKILSDSIQLPGTTDSNRKGYKNSDTTTMRLNRIFLYEGAAWYQKKINIPQEWHDKYVALFMERTKSSHVWIDEHYIGQSQLLASPQKYDLSSFLSPGDHTITIRIDNSLRLTPYGNVHIYTDETQTNWNGIIGRLYLEASTKTHIEDIRVYPDIENRKIKAQLAIDNPLSIDTVDITLTITKELHGKKTKLPVVNLSLPCDSIITVEYALEDNADLWDEYHQPVYSLNAEIHNADKKIRDSKTATFGMRKFATRGTQFTINGRTTFLRGKQDACVFPLTGHPPMDTAEWIRIFKIAKSYGINHYRFHSWCPPHAAFEAADQLGIYLQPELPFWGGLESDTLAAMLKAEGIALLKSYANHPSFVMFAAGNEIWSGHDRVEKIVTELKALDSRPLYTQGSNNSIGYVGPTSYSDFHIAARTPYKHDTVLTHTRLTHAYADSRGGGILNTHLPSTNTNFDYAVSQVSIPLLSHEIGQYQIYPDYDEIKKYTGVVRAWNLEVFRAGLEKAGMLDQDDDFTKASGAWSALCYKAEMEAVLRTNGFAGFQLLDLQDFPGQGTALVGILDAFMDSKNVISREEWIQSCNDVVMLLSFDRYVWSNKETFSATVEVANYSNKTINDQLLWKITDGDNIAIGHGAFKNLELRQGTLTDVGTINFPLAAVNAPQKLTIGITLKTTGYSNSYPVWVFPELKTEEAGDAILVTTNINTQVLNKLKEGANVLLFPDKNSVAEKSVGGLFPPDFWNYGMFKKISEWNKQPVSPGTLGILTDPSHPLFNSFPTDFHTNWHWWSIVHNSNPLILDETPKEYRPIVQVIDNMERNHKLGLVFEFKAGKGKLLVCMSPLTSINRPEAIQLYNSLINYMKSNAFNPSQEASEVLLKKLL